MTPDLFRELLSGKMFEIIPPSNTTVINPYIARRAKILFFCLFKSRETSKYIKLKREAIPPARPGNKETVSKNNKTIMFRAVGLNKYENFFSVHTIIPIHATNPNWSDRSENTGTPVNPEMLNSPTTPKLLPKFQVRENKVAILKYLNNSLCGIIKADERKQTKINK